MPWGRRYTAWFVDWTLDLDDVSDRTFRAFARLTDRLTARGNTDGLLPSDPATLRKWMGITRTDHAAKCLDELIQRGCIARLDRPTRFLTEAPEGGSKQGQRGAKGEQRDFSRETLAIRGALIVPNWAKYQGFALGQVDEIALSRPVLFSSPSLRDKEGTADAAVLELDGGEADPVLAPPPSARLPDGFPRWPRSWYRARAQELAEAMGYARLDRIPLAGGSVESVSAPGVMVGWLVRAWDGIDETARARAKAGRKPATKQTAASWWRRTCDDISSGTPSARTWAELRGAMAWLRANMPDDAVRAGVLEFDALLQGAKKGAT